MIKEFKIIFNENLSIVDNVKDALNKLGKGYLKKNSLVIVSIGEALYKKYKDQGFEILDFPCNQFGHQAPGSDQEIREFCTAKYDVSFRQFKKIDVNGKEEEPLYTYLKSQKGELFKKIKWNFTKFLVDKEGNVVERFGPTTKPEDIEDKIKEVL